MSVLVNYSSWPWPPCLPAFLSFVSSLLTSNQLLFLEPIMASCLYLFIPFAWNALDSLPENFIHPLRPSSNDASSMRSDLAVPGEISFSILALIVHSSEEGHICCHLTCSVSDRKTRWIRLPLLGELDPVQGPLGLWDFHEWELCSVTVWAPHLCGQVVSYREKRTRRVHTHLLTSHIHVCVFHKLPHLVFSLQNRSYFPCFVNEEIEGSDWLSKLCGVNGGIWF